MSGQRTTNFQCLWANSWSGSVIWPITPFSSVLQQNFPKIKIHHTFFAANRPAILVKQRAKDVVQIITKLYPSVQNFLFFLLVLSRHSHLPTQRRICSYHHSVLLAVTGGWCWFAVREKYCWLAGGWCWFGMRENYCCWKPAEHSSFSKVYYSFFFRKSSRKATIS